MGEEETQIEETAEAGAEEAPAPAEEDAGAEKRIRQCLVFALTEPPVAFCCGVALAVAAAALVQPGPDAAPAVAALAAAAVAVLALGVPPSVCLAANLLDDWRKERRKGERER